MKLIFLTYSYGERTCIRLVYSHQIYFAGNAPEVNKLITLELPGLKYYSKDSVLGWLKENCNSASAIAENLSERREISEVP